MGWMMNCKKCKHVCYDEAITTCTHPIGFGPDGECPIEEVKKAVNTIINFCTEEVCRDNCPIESILCEKFKFRTALPISWEKFEVDDLLPKLEVDPLFCEHGSLVYTSEDESTYKYVCSHNDYDIDKGCPNGHNCEAEPEEEE